MLSQLLDVQYKNHLIWMYMKSVVRFANESFFEKISFNELINL